MIPRPGFLRQLIRAGRRVHGDELLPLDQVVARYDLGEKWRARPVGDGVSSKTFILSNERGTWTLKQYRREFQPPAVLFIHSLLCWLETQGFPAPRLRLTRDGQNYVALDGTCYALFTYAVGYRADWFLMPKSLRHRHIEQAGATLARFHLLTANLELPGHRAQGYKTVRSDERWDAYKGYLDRWVELTGRMPAPGDGGPLFSDATRDHIGRRLAELVECEEGQPMLPVSIIHGDYGPWNLLFGPLAVLGTVLDFDDVHIERRIDEVVASLLCFAGRPDGSMRLEDAHMFLHAYQSIGALNAEELQKVPIALEHHLLERVVTITGRIMNASSNRDRQKLRRVIASLGWMETQGRTILRTMTETLSSARSGLEPYEHLPVEMQLSRERSDRVG